MTATALAPRDFADVSDDADIARAIGAAIPQAKYPPGFEMRASGLYHDNGEGAELVCGRFDVVAQTRDRNSQAWGILLRWKDSDDQPHQWSLPRSMMAGDGREVRSALLDGGLYVSPAIRHRNALQTCLASVVTNRRARAVSRVGWADGSFALPDRTVGENGGDLVVYQGVAALDHEYRTSGTLEEWQTGVARYAVGNSRIALALSAAFVGPLLAAMGEEGGGVHYRGKSSIGKSTVLQAAASVWGAPSFVRQWRATQNGLEGLAEQANDTLLILDELAQLDVKEAGSVAYLLANGVGKTRAAQSGEARASKKWRTFFLSSGEISLGDHAKSDGRGRKSAAGQEVRILDVEADAGGKLGLFEHLHDLPKAEALARHIKSASASTYGVAGPAFVEALIAAGLDTVAHGLRKGLDQFVSDHLPADATGQVARACRRFGLIGAAGEAASRLGVLPWAAGEAIGAAKIMFASWLDSRGGAGAMEDQGAIEQVRSYLITHGASRFQPMHDDSPAVIHNRAGFWRSGTSGNREYLIPAGTWKSEVCAGLSPKAVAELLVQRGHLAVDGAGKSSVAVTAPGIGKARFYIVLPSIFEGEA